MISDVYDFKITSIVNLVEEKSLQLLKFFLMVSTNGLEFDLALDQNSQARNRTSEIFSTEYFQVLRRDLRSKPSNWKFFITG